MMKVVIEAYGAVHCAGTTVDDLSELIINHRCLSQIVQNGYVQRPAFPLSEIIEDKLKRLASDYPYYAQSDRVVKMTLLALHQLFEQFPEVQLNGKGIICIGTSRGCTGLLEYHHQYFLNNYRCSPYSSPFTTNGIISSSIAYQLKQIHLTAVDVSQTCSSSAQALLTAVAWLKAGMADWAIAGGVDAPLTSFTFAQTAALGIYTSYTDTFPCRPFNAERKNTFALGEAAVLFLLKPEHKATYHLLHVLGAGFAYEPPPSPTGIDRSGDVFKRAMKQALNEGAGNIDVIFPHAPGTVFGDEAEYRALTSIFSDATPIFASKYLTGHTYGASFALNILFFLACTHKQISFTYPFPVYINQHIKLKQPRYALINAAGFGGNVVSMVLDAGKFAHHTAEAKTS